MSSSLEIEFCNGLTGDPAVAIYLQQLGEIVLFDAGDLSRREQRELLKMRTVCISHTHVDHFIGFDQIIRVNIPHSRLVEVIGPKGIIENVRSKLLGYAWNLLELDQVRYIVHEVHHNHVETAQLTNTNNFTPETLSLKTGQELSKHGWNIPLSHGRFSIHATVLDHGMEVCAFSLALPDQQVVSKAALERQGFAPGPWIGQLQRAVTAGLQEDVIHVEGRGDFKASALAQMFLNLRPGEKISYVTDIIFSKDNVAKFWEMASGSNTLICETNYRQEHRHKAFEKKHLTTRQAALLAAACGASELKVFHISAIYGEDSETSRRESQKFFEAFRSLTLGELHQLVQDEIKGSQQSSD